MNSYYVELTGVGESHLANEEINVDDLADNEAIIKAEYSMISAGTELSRAYAIKKGFSYPVRPGYSLVGKVLKKGNACEFDCGDYVFAGCPHSSVSRFAFDQKTQGGMIMKLPEDINHMEATALNLCLIALQGVNLTDVKIGDTVAVFGLGNLGIITALMFQKLGAKVIGLDPMEYRCNMAKKMGIKNCYSGKEQLSYINSFTNDKGAEICVDVTGASPAIIAGVNCCRQYGTMVLLGSPREGYSCDITPTFNTIHMKNLKVLGAFNNTCPVKPVEGSNNSRLRNFKICCDLIKNKDIDISKMISKVMDPKDCKQAYYDLMYDKNNTNCIVFDWNNY